MHFKNIAISLAAVSLLVMNGAVAFAHGGHHYYTNYTSYQAQPAYYNCPYDDCTEAGTHLHGNDGCYYYGHYANDGHAQCAAPSYGYGYGCGGGCHHW